MCLGLLLSGLLLTIAVPRATRSFLTTPIPLQAMTAQQASCRASLREAEVPTPCAEFSIRYLAKRPRENAYSMRLMAPDNSRSRNRCNALGRPPGMGSHLASSHPFPLHLTLHIRMGFNSWRLFSGGGNNNGSVPIGGIGDATEDNGDGDAAVELNVSHSEEATCPSDNNGDSSPWLWLSALWNLYVMWLRQSPLLIKAITSGALAMSGDMAAQCFEFQQKKRSGPFRRDNRRLLAIAIDSIVTAPVLHAMYGLMEFCIPTTGGGVLPAAAHLVLDTFVLDPVFVACFFCTTGLLESRPFKTDVLPALNREFWPAVQASWRLSFFFSPLQYATFRYLPLEFRVLSVNVCDMVWTAVLSYFSHRQLPDSDPTVETIDLPSRRGKAETDSRSSNRIVRLMQA